MSENVIVGKHALESLTIGMYSDPFTLYREYIQNAADSIDNAVKESILKKEQARIDILVDDEKSFISIKDNGTGINSEDAYKILCDIGNSQKDYKESRGFRGIGRLGGLGYADRVTFITSAKNEEIKTFVSWDCIKLKEFLQVGKYNDYDIIRVIKEVTEYKKEPEAEEKHYFEVILEGIDPQFSELLEPDDVKSYLHTVAPLPFDYQKFIYATQIREEIKKENKPLEEYHIYLNNSINPLYKNYKTHFKTGHQEKTLQDDDITEIEFFKGFSEKNEIMYIGWIGLCNFYGTVKNDYMRGIRVRKGNILIGDERTFDQFFSSEPYRANGVFIGEVYIYFNDIIPNARRDDFEKNSAYKKLFQKLNTIADIFNQKYRRYYSQKNSVTKKLNDIEFKISKIAHEIQYDGISSESHKESLIKEKEDLEKQFEEKHKELEKIVSKMDEDDKNKKNLEKILNNKDTVKKKIIELENDLVNTEYKGKKLLSSLSKDERRLFRKIIEIIDSNLDKETAKMLHDKIIDAIKPGKF